MLRIAGIGLGFQFKPETCVYIDVHWILSFSMLLLVYLEAVAVTPHPPTRPLNPQKERMQVVRNE